jgi:hypothetical protein
LEKKDKKDKETKKKKKHRTPTTTLGSSLQTLQRTALYQVIRKSSHKPAMDISEVGDSTAHCQRYKHLLGSSLKNLHKIRRSNDEYMWKP